MKKQFSSLLLVIGMLIGMIQLPVYAEPTNNDLPVSYDLRDVDGKMFVTAARNQGRNGDCWAFAAMAALESSILKKYTDLDASEVDLSEDHMDRHHGYDYGVRNESGGRYELAVNYLLRGAGPYKERDYPYVLQEGAISPTPVTMGEIPAEATPSNPTIPYYVTDVMFLENVDALKLTKATYMEAIKATKEAIMKYGAVSTNIYQSHDGNKTFPYTNEKYYNPDTNAYFCDGKDGKYNSISNHAVAIVGWNDNFPKSNFATQPDFDGAWLCKDAQGDTFGDKGFYWVSYQSACVTSTQYCFTGVVKAEDTDFSVIAQHDALGLTGAMDNDYSQSWDDIKDAYFNRYVANEDGVLNSVGFYTMAKNAEYKVYTVSDFTEFEKYLIEKHYDEYPGISLEEAEELIGTDETITKLLKVQSGTLAEAGWHNIKLDNSMELTKGQVYGIGLYVNFDKGMDFMTIQQTHPQKSLPHYVFESTTAKGVNEVHPKNSKNIIVGESETYIFAPSETVQNFEYPDAPFDSFDTDGNVLIDIGKMHFGYNDTDVVLGNLCLKGYIETRQENTKTPEGLSGVMPTTKENKDGKIDGTTVDMEYSTSKDFVNSKDCTDGHTVVEPGTYFVRYKATKTTKASTSVEVVVSEFVQKEFLITFDANGGSVSPSAIETVDFKLPTLPVATYLDNKYIFEKWIDEKGEAVTSDTVFESATTVFAKWNISCIATVSGSAVYGQVLTANLSKEYDDKEISYQWLRNNQVIENATLSTYSLTVEDIGAKINFEISSTKADNKILSEQTTEVTKASQDAPNTPVLEKATTNTITVKVESGCEYSLDKSNWQVTGEFVELEADTEYTIYARFVETKTHFASLESEGLKVKTEAEAKPDPVDPVDPADPKPVDPTPVNPPAPGVEIGDDKVPGSEAPVKTETREDGVVITTTTDENGNVSAEIKIPEEIVITTVQIPAQLGDAEGFVFVEITSENCEAYKIVAIYEAGKVSVKLQGNSTVKIISKVNPFVEVSAYVDTIEHWAKASINAVAELGLFKGTSDTTFLPEENMTREQMWMVLSRVQGEGKANMEEAKAWAMENAITDGSNPKGSVTREQFVTLLWRAVNKPKSKFDLSKYSDSSNISDYAKEAFAWAVEIGLVSGTTEITLSPQGFATRAQIATIFSRFAK